MGLYSATNEGEEALAAATAETVIALIGSSTKRGKIVEWGVSFDGVSPTEAAVQVKLFRTTADDGTATAATELPWDPADPAATLAAKHSYTAEPTKASLPLAGYDVHPQAGIVIQYPLGREIILAADNTDGFAIECTAPAVVNCHAYIVWEE